MCVTPRYANYDGPVNTNTRIKLKAVGQVRGPRRFLTPYPPPAPAFSHLLYAPPANAHELGDLHRPPSSQRLHS